MIAVAMIAVAMIAVAMIAVVMIAVAMIAVAMIAVVVIAVAMIAVAMIAVVMIAVAMTAVAMIAATMILVVMIAVAMFRCVSTFGKLPFFQAASVASLQRPQPKTNSDEEFKNSEKAETTNFETQNEKINFPRENSNDGGKGESTSTAKTTTTDSFDGTRSSGIKVSDGGDDAAEVVAVAPFAGMEMLKDEIPRKNDGAGSRVNVTATTLNNFGQRKKGQPHIARSNRDSIPRYHPFLMHISALIIFSAAHSKDSTVNIY